MLRFLPGLLTIVLLSAGARAESLGAYEHGSLRTDDRKLIVCYDEASAVEAARAVNVVMLELRDDLAAAPDEFARQTIFQTQLYPSAGWGVLLGAIRDLRCDLVEEASHISRRTIMLGPDILQAAGIAHNVIQSDILAGAGDGTVPVWIITTESVPPVGG